MPNATAPHGGPSADRSHLRLVECDLPLYEAMLAGHVAFGDRLGVPVPADWSDFGLEPYRYMIGQLGDHPDWAGWLSYLLVDDTLDALVAIGGYKGPPTGQNLVEFASDEEQAGLVEIGYQTIKAYRSRGYATTFARMLIERAFADPRVNVVQAHTLAEENHSVAVLRNLGFVQKAEFDDAEDGLIWRWQLPKP